jgi:hypothetical protein
MRFGFQPFSLGFDKEKLRYTLFDLTQTQALSTGRKENFAGS